MIDDAPEFPFRIDADGVECQVIRGTVEEIADALGCDPADAEAYVGTGHVLGHKGAYVVMREYDERVLLHEVGHVIFRRAEGLVRSWVESAAGDDELAVVRAEEGIVRAFTKGLWGMGWRWRVRDGSSAVIERDRNRAYDAREAVLAVVREAADEDEALRPLYERALAATRR